MIENFKNLLLRHDKQSRYSSGNRQHHTVNEPAGGPGVLYTAKAHAAADSVAAGLAGDANCPTQGHHAGQQQKMHDPAQRAYEENMVARIAQEGENKSKLPKYPGLERWRLIEKLGDGGFSNVYRAIDTRGELDEVAIKVVRNSELNPMQRASTLREVQIMRGLNHPNIIQLISFSESRAYYYLVLELLKGGELFHQIVRFTYFSEDLSRHIIVQVADALRYLHEEKGIVHRDIKPENLLFEPIPFMPSKKPKPHAPEDEDKIDEGEFVPGVGAGGIGRIKIADFGLSKVVWDSQTMTPCGTVGYAAPEIVKDERYSKSVDMWALGCVLYTLVCGFPPFYGESTRVLTEKVARGQYTFLSPWWDGISKSAQDLISQLLTVDPKQRYTIEEFMAHPWIRQTSETTYAAADAPPLATPRTGRELMADFEQYTPGKQRRMDFRSLGAINLRELFDVGYAAHRIEEEVKRRKNWKKNYRGASDFDPPDEVEESDEDDGTPEASSPTKMAKPSVGVGDVERNLQRTNLGNPPAAQRMARGTEVASTGVAVAQRKQQQKEVRRKNNAEFELTLENATLLGRRNKAGVAA